MFESKADAQVAYDSAAARIGHIPGLPDIDKVWPTWEQEKARLAQMDVHLRLPVIYQQQDVHQERKFGLRPPEALRGLVERMKGVDWLAKHCLLVFDDDSPAASRNIAIQSNGQVWTTKNESEGRRFTIQGRTSIHKDTGRIGITIYHPGFDEPGVLAEEIYHIVFGIMQQTRPEAYRATQRWYGSCLRDGMDPTISLDEAFSKTMGLEEPGTATGLPRSVVRHACDLFSARGNVPDSVMKKLKLG